jgi:transposase
VRALEQRFPSSVRVFAPSETAAARAQLGSRRFKTDDRDCAALTYLARQGYGRLVADDPVEALSAAVRHRRGLVTERKVAQQRLHDQLNALCPGLSALAGHGRALELENTSGQAVLACAVAFTGRAPMARSLQARAPGRLFASNAQYWAERWKSCLPPPPDAAVRAERLGRSVARWQAIRADIAAVEVDIEALLASTAGVVLASLPGVGVIRAAGFAAFSLPIERFPSADHLYSATGLAPTKYQSATINRTGRIARTGLAEHRDALMGIAWGLSQRCGPFIERDHQLRARGRTRSRPASRLPVTPAVLPTGCCAPSNPSTNSATVRAGTRASGDGCVSYAARRRNLACRPLASGPHTANTKACPARATDQPADHAAPPATTPALHTEHRPHRRCQSATPKIEMDFRLSSGPLGPVFRPH